MLLTVPRDIVLAIALYLDHRSYYALACSNVALFQALTAESTLRAFLKEKDTTVTRTDLLRVLIHMSSHLYLVHRNVFIQGAPIQQALPVTNHLDLKPRHFPLGAFNIDIYHRCYRGALVGEHVRDLLFSSVNQVSVLLYCNGDIGVNHGMFPDTEVRYPVQAIELLCYLQAGVYYRNRERYYCLLTPEGETQVVHHIPDPTNVVSIHRPAFKFGPNEYLSIRHILYRNGCLYQLDNIGYCHPDNEPFFLGPYISYIKKYIPVMNDGWLLRHEGQLKRDDFGDRIIRFYDVGRVTDMVMVNNALYFLVQGKKLFVRDSINEDAPAHLIYESERYHHALSAYGGYNQVTIALHMK